MKKKKKASEYAYPNLIIEMDKNGDTFEHLARVLGITQVTVISKVYGRSKFKLLETEKLCEYYKKDYEELFKGE